MGHSDVHSATITSQHAGTALSEPTARIWIDADACPRDVKELVFRAGERLRIRVAVVANKAMWVNSGGKMPCLSPNRT